MNFYDERSLYSGMGVIGGLIGGRYISKEFKNKTNYSMELTGLGLAVAGSYMVSMKGSTATYAGLGLAGTGIAVSAMSFANKQGLLPRESQGSLPDTTDEDKKLQTPPGGGGRIV